MEHPLLVSDAANFGIFLEESLRIAEEEARIRFDGIYSFRLVGCKLFFDAVSDLEVLSNLFLSITQHKIEFIKYSFMQHKN